MFLLFVNALRNVFINVSWSCDLGLPVYSNSQILSSTRRHFKNRHSVIKHYRYIHITQQKHIKIAQNANSVLFFIPIHKTHKTQTTSKSGTMSYESQCFCCRLLGRYEGGRIHKKYKDRL